MSDAIGLQLLRERALLLDIPPLAVTEGLVDFGGAAGADGFYLVEIDACLVAGVFEHGVRLASLEHDDFGAFQLIPRKRWIGLASGEEETVHLVDLGEMECDRRFPLIERGEPLAQGRLNDVCGAIFQGCERRAAWRRNRPFG